MAVTTHHCRGEGRKARQRFIPASQNTTEATALTLQIQKPDVKREHQGTTEVTEDTAQVLLLLLFFPSSKSPNFVKTSSGVCNTNDEK